MTDKLRRLHEGASAITCSYGIVTASASGPHEDIALAVYGSFPRFVTHDKSTFIAARDMALIHYLRNHAADFIALIEAARIVSKIADRETVEFNALHYALQPFSEDND